MPPDRPVQEAIRSPRRPEPVGRVRAPAEPTAVRGRPRRTASSAPPGRPGRRTAEPIAPAARVRVGLAGHREQPGEAGLVGPRGGEAGPFVEPVHQGLADVGGPDPGRGGVRSPPTSPSTLPRKADSYSASSPTPSTRRPTAFRKRAASSAIPILVAFGPLQQRDDLGLPSASPGGSSPAGGPSPTGPVRSALQADRLAQLLPHGPVGRLPLQEHLAPPPPEDGGQQEAGPEQRGQFGPAPRPLDGAFEGADRPGRGSARRGRSGAGRREVRGRGVAPGRVLVQALQADRLQVARHLRMQARRRDRARRRRTCSHVSAAVSARNGGRPVSSS